MAPEVVAGTGSREDVARTSFARLWAELAPVGRQRDGGYRRFAWTDADLALREWFTAQARSRGMATETDRNGNLWAWWGEPAPGAVVTGSHLDSVPGGGAFDGPLGVVGGLLAVDDLRARGVVPGRPLAVVVFADEEGARFGRACTGSRLLTGALEADRARALTDDDGTSLAEAMHAAGHDPHRLGRDDDALARIGVFVELHVEQGRGLATTGDAVGVASMIRPHGRWRFTFTGEGNHAGSTLLDDRRDPVLPFARTALAARTAALAARSAGEPGAVATFGRLRVDPNGTNAIAARVEAWLDARADSEGTVEGLVAAVEAAAVSASHEHGVQAAVTRESWTPAVGLDARLRDRLAALLGRPGAPVPVLATGAGHDAGVLAAHVPTAMLFARNPTGTSHSPDEHATEEDCVAGVLALSTALEDLLAVSVADR